MAFPPGSFPPLGEALPTTNNLPRWSDSPRDAVGAGEVCGNSSSGVKKIERLVQQEIDQFCTTNSHLAQRRFVPIQSEELTNLIQKEMGHSRDINWDERLYYDTIDKVYLAQSTPLSGGTPLTALIDLSTHTYYHPSEDATGAIQWKWKDTQGRVYNASLGAFFDPNHPNICFDLEGRSFKKVPTPPSSLRSVWEESSPLGAGGGTINRAVGSVVGKVLHVGHTLFSKASGKAPPPPLEDRTPYRRNNAGVLTISSPFHKDILSEVQLTPTETWDISCFVEEMAEQLETSRTKAWTLWQYTMAPYPIASWEERLETLTEPGYKNIQKAVEESQATSHPISLEEACQHWGAAYDPNVPADAHLAPAVFASTLKGMYAHETTDTAEGRNAAIRRHLMNPNKDYITGLAKHLLRRTEDDIDEKLFHDFPSQTTYREGSDFIYFSFKEVGLVLALPKKDPNLAMVIQFTDAKGSYEFKDFDKMVETFLRLQGHIEDKVKEKEKELFKVHITNITQHTDKVHTILDKLSTDATPGTAVSKMSQAFQALQQSIADHCKTLEQEAKAEARSKILNMISHELETFEEEYTKTIHQDIPMTAGTEVIDALNTLGKSLGEAKSLQDLFAEHSSSAVMAFEQLKFNPMASEVTLLGAPTTPFPVSISIKLDSSVIGELKIVNLFKTSEEAEKLSPEKMIEQPLSTGNRNTTPPIAQGTVTPVNPVNKEY